MKKFLIKIINNIDNMKCSTCKLKNECNEMKEERNKTLCAYLWELDENYFWNKNNK